MAEYPTEDAITARQVYEARRHLENRRAEQAQRTRQIMAEHDFAGETLPSLQELREERVRLTEQTRHHKDEQDSLTLDIEGQEGATQVYQVAARVQRYEHFAARSHTYVQEQLPLEIEQVIEEDQRHSEEEVAAYIQELQTRRENTLKKVSAVQQRSTKKGKATETSDDLHQDDEETRRVIEHAEANVNESQTLSEKVKKFRALKTKLSTEIVREKRDSKNTEQQLNARIKNAELSNARDARQCKELNSGNAALTSNAQLLMSQLNIEHYGMDNAPTKAQLIEDRKAREATPELTPANEESERRSRRSKANADSVSVSSRQSRPPLVASKPTASQKSRDVATKQEREERRSSEVASHSSSRRQSLSKPPLVSSKPTASQLQREEQSASRTRSQPIPAH